MVATPLNPQTLPTNDNLGPYAFSIQLDGEYFMQKGRMIAYYGQMRFENLMATSVPTLVARHFGSPKYLGDWIVATGRGMVILGDRGLDLNSYTLEDGNLTIRAANLLGFQPTLELKQSIIPGFLTLLGTGQFVAASNGPVIFAEPPLRVDPQALLGWADAPSPCVHFDTSWMGGLLSAGQAFMGRRSGEEEQMDFTGTGTILIQSSEKMVPGDDAAVQAAIQSIDVLHPQGLQQINQHVAAKLRR